MKEFKDFAMRGNVIDMAVGVVIGAAFGKIVSSLVDNIIMPVVGYITGGVNFTDYKFVLQEGVKNGEEIITPEVAIGWGTLVQTIIDFLIIAFCIFLAIKFVQKLRKQKEEEVPAAPAGPTTEELLTQIRDILKDENNAGK